MSVDAQTLPPRYENCERIGRGGMGDIFLAHDRQLGRNVAIKVLAERFASDASVRERFTREALTAARLSGHPHIVTLFDVGEWNDRPFIVMEYLAGGTLGDRLRKGTPPAPKAFEWLEQAAEALDAAHSAGIVHRDVKPANLMFDARGELNVVDFGIARVLDQTTAGMTLPGTILGTSGYLSPEQANGEEATAASDIYALGVVAYELVTGSRPFARSSATAEAAAHIHEPVPSAAARAGLHPDVDDVFARALAKDPAARHESATELVEDLRTAFDAGEQMTGTIPVPTSATVAMTDGAPPYERPQRSWLVPALVALLLLAAGGVAAAVLAGDGGEPRVETRVITRREVVTTKGAISVRTETIPTTVEAEAEEEPEQEEPPASPPPASPPAPNQDASVDDGIRLTDESTGYIRQGNYEAALPVAQRALAALKGSGHIYEAYANYNYGKSLLELGRCAEAIPYFDRSERIQGYRSEIERDRNAARKC